MDVQCLGSTAGLPHGCWALVIRELHGNDRRAIERVSWAMYDLSRQLIQLAHRLRYKRDFPQWVVRLRPLDMQPGPGVTMRPVARLWNEALRFDVRPSRRLDVAHVRVYLGGLPSGTCSVPGCGGEEVELHELSNGAIVLAAGTPGDRKRYLADTPTRHYLGATHQAKRARRALWSGDGGQSSRSALAAAD